MTKIKCLILLTLILFTNCTSDKFLLESNPTISYSFFVAGHTYGHPIHYEIGLHHTFKNQIDTLNSIEKMKFGILTGDVVPFSDSMYFMAAQSELARFNIPIHVAAGNHDRGPSFQSFFNQYYYDFKYNNDLFILLSPENWNIIDEQKAFLENSLLKYKDVNNVFIFLHELLWWSPHNKFAPIRINFKPNYPGSSNFWDEIFSMFENIDNKVYFFAGDLGAHKNADAYMYYEETENISFIASGMGSGINDNIIIVNKFENDSIDFKLMKITDDDMYEWHDLKSYNLPE